MLLYNCDIHAALQPMRQLQAGWPRTHDNQIMHKTTPSIQILLKT
jgi:hypothetical protein